MLMIRRHHRGEAAKVHPELKANIALTALRGEATIAELCRKHQLSDTVIGRLKLLLVKQAHQVFVSSTSALCRLSQSQA
jgi:transposase-like protein